MLLSPKLSDFKDVLFEGVWHTAMLNTFLECICSTTLSVVTGFLFAYAVVKAEIPGKKFFSLVPVIHLVTPPFVGGLSFILLFGRQGFITHTLLGLNVSLYGFTGLLVAQVLCFFPIAYLMCVQTLNGIPSSYEQAALNMGSGRMRIFFTVTLPLSLPGVFSALLFIAVSVLSDFGNPMIVAGRFRVLAVEIYTQLMGWLNAGKSCVLGIVLVLPSIALFVLQNHVMKKQEKKLALIGGKDSPLPTKKSLPLTKVFLTCFCSFVSLAVIVQFVAIIAGTFQKIWGVNTAFTWEHVLSISHYIVELKNSVFFALISAFLSTIIACVTVFFVSRMNFPLKKYMDVCAQLPASIPGSLFGLALSISSSKISFRNSHVLIVIAMTVAFLPFSYRIISSVFSQIKISLDEVAQSLGATKFRVLYSILMPISAGGIFSSFIYDFVRGVGTVSAVIFLVSFNTPLASVKILNLAEQGDWGDAACLAMVLTLITFSILGIGKFFYSKIKTGDKNAGKTKS